MHRLHEDGWIAFVLFLVVVCSTGGVAVGQAIGAEGARIQAHVEREAMLGEARDVPAPEQEGQHEHEYQFEESADLQNPELPTGCEATALATTLRMNGVEVSKEDVADMMPKTDGSDFVNAFWGDPYSVHGWACMSPCVVETAKRFIPVEKTVVDASGTPLVYLPAPCVVWVTMGLEDPMVSDYEQDGHGLLWNSHCVTLLAADEATVTCIDPLEGVMTYPFSKFDAAYMANGKQAVYIADRGYMPELR